MQEMDYIKEANNGVKFSSTLAINLLVGGNIEDVVVPEMYVEQTTGRVPTMQWVEEEVHAIAKEQSQPLPGTTEPREVNMTAIYLDVVGVSKKNHVFGIGCRSRKYTKCGSRASSSQDLGVASEEKIKVAVDAQLQMRLDAQRAEMRQEIQAQMQAQVEAQVQSQVQVQLQAHLEEQKKVFEQMLAQFKSGSGHSLPS